MQPIGSYPAATPPIALAVTAANISGLPLPPLASGPCPYSWGWSGTVEESRRPMLHAQQEGDELHSLHIWKKKEPDFPCCVLQIGCLCDAHCQKGGRGAVSIAGVNAIYVSRSRDYACRSGGQSPGSVAPGSVSHAACGPQLLNGPDLADSTQEN